MRIRFDKVGEFNKIYDGTRYLVLFGTEQYNAIYNKIRYLTSEKSGITNSITHNFAKIRIDSYNSLSLSLTFHNFIILIKSQILIRIKITTIVIYFWKKFRMRTNPIHNFLNECISIYFLNECIVFNVKTRLMYGCSLVMFFF